eukprot:2522366-Rhodomonas_salina.2
MNFATDAGRVRHHASGTRESGSDTSWMCSSSGSPLPPVGDRSAMSEPGIAQQTLRMSGRMLPALGTADEVSRNRACPTEHK